MNDSEIAAKLDIVINLLRTLLALELSKGGMTHEQIRKHLGVAKQTVNEMLRGVRKEAS